MAMLVADVARQLRTTPTTVRRWSSEFAEALHAPARGGHNAVRRFDGHDMQVLDRAAELLGQTGATYAQVKTTLLDEFVGPSPLPQPPDEPEPERVDTTKALPRAPEPVKPAPVRSIAPDLPTQTENTPSLEELVAAAVTAATRGQSIHIAGLNDTVEALTREARELKTRVIALEDLALSKRGRWPF